MSTLRLAGIDSYHVNKKQQSVSFMFLLEDEQSGKKQYYYTHVYKKPSGWTATRIVYHAKEIDCPLCQEKKREEMTDDVCVPFSNDEPLREKVKNELVNHPSVRLKILFSEIK